MYFLFLYTFALHVSGVICTQLREHKLQSTALDVCNGCTLQFVLMKMGANNTRNM
jgi:hypothetical protein